MEPTSLSLEELAAQLLAFLPHLIHPSESPQFS